MPSCCVKQCGARKNINQPTLTLHRFPTKEILKNKWLKIIGMENINPKHKIWYVCSLHFEETYFNRTLDVTRKRDNAVPSDTLLKAGFIPSEFICLPDQAKQISDATERPCVIKKQRKELIQEYIDMGKRTYTKQVDHGESSSESSAKTQSQNNTDLTNRKPGKNLNYKVHFDKVTQDVKQNIDTKKGVGEMLREPYKDMWTEEPLQMEENVAEFSWEKPSLMCIVSDVLETAQLVPDPPITPLLVKEEPAFITCNLCGENIAGCRFTCCECDLEACACCESSHASHLMLRVPPVATPEEVFAALEAVRCRLALLRGTPYIDPLKVELKPDPDAETETEETTNMESFNTHTEVLSKYEKKDPNVKKIQRDNFKVNKPPEVKIEGIDIDALENRTVKRCPKFIEVQHFERSCKRTEIHKQLSKKNNYGDTVKRLKKHPQAIVYENVRSNDVGGMVSKTISVRNDYHVQDALSFAQKNTEEIEDALNTESDDHEYSRRRMRRHSSEEPEHEAYTDVEFLEELYTEAVPSPSNQCRTLETVSEQCDYSDK